MKKRIYRRIVSGVLTFTTLFSQYGTIANAYENSNLEDFTEIESASEQVYGTDSEFVEEDYEDTNEEISVGTKEEAKIVSEIVDARDEFSKQYLMSDNSKSMVLYSEPLHYLTEDGTYTEIDNSVEKTEEGYENVDNTYSVVFTDNEESRGEVKFEEDHYQINWQFIDETGTSENTTALEAATNNSENSDILLLEECSDAPPELEVDVKNEGSDYGEEEEIGHVIKSSTVSYDGYSGGVKLEYAPTGLGVKENIILSGKESGNEFTFKIQLFGLKARVNSANEVELFDEKTDEVKYFFPAPFMMDADSKESYDVWYSLSDTQPEKKTMLKEDSECSIEVLEEEQEGDSDENYYKTDNSDDTGLSAYESFEEDEIADELSDEEIELSVFEELENPPAADESEEVLIEDAANTEQTEYLADVNVPLGNVSEEVSHSEDGYIYLTLTADEEWLENATYPVIIDPVITKAGTGLDIDSGSVNNLGTKNTSLYVGCENTELPDGKKDAIYRSYIKFGLPNIEKGSIITDAQLYLSGTVQAGNKHYIVARKVITDWAYNNLSWDGRPNTDERILDYAVNGGYFDITRAVSDWYISPDENYGLEFSAYDENIYLRDSINLSSIKNRPYLKVIFRHYVGLENYWSSHSVSVGTAGMGYINDYTGSLTVVNTDVSTNGLRMPFNIQHVYNSNTDEGWKLSYDQRIEVPANELDVKTYPYVFYDEDGTKHYFKAQDVTYQENGEKKIAKKSPADSIGYPAAADEDGLKVFIVPVTDKKLKDKYPLKLLDKSGSVVKYFDTAGHLAMISDSNQYENGSNEAKKAENRILITQEKDNEIKPLDKYDETIDALEAIYNYTLLKETSASDEKVCKENMLRANAMLSELVSDVYALTDYKIAKEVQFARNTIETMCASDKLTVAQIKKDSQAAKKAMTTARSLADAMDLQGERIRAVSDAVDNTSTITYNDGYISEISDPTKDDPHAKNSYHYTDGRLTKIEFSNGKSAIYTYDGNGNLNCMLDNSGYQVEFTYDKSRIVKVHESARASEGQTYTIKYNDDNTTSFRFSGIDDVYGEYEGKIDDVINTYVFDEKGRVISAYSTNVDDTDGDGKADRKIEVYGANACTYEDTAAKQMARTSYDDQSPESYPNLLKDPGFEKDFQEWKLYNPNEPGIPEEYRISLGNAETPDNSKESYLGSRHLLLTSKGDEFALVEQKLELEKGNYVISYRFKSVEQDKDGILCPTIRKENFKFTELKDGKCIKDDEDWSIIAYKFSIEEKNTYYIGFYAEKATGRFDCAHLETGSVAHNYTTTEAVSASANADKKSDDSSIRNKIKDSAVTGRQTQNLLKDHSFEHKAADWTVFKNISSEKVNPVSIKNANKIEVKTDAYEKMSYLGNNAVVCNIKNIKKGSAGVSQNVTIPSNGRYTLSAYVKAYGIANSNAYLKAEGPDKTYYSEKLTSSTLTQFSEGWDRLKVSFDAKAGDVYTIAVHAEGTDATAKGYVSFDCIQLEKGEVANEYNALEDGNFEASQGGLPYTWSNLKNVEYQDEPAEGIDGGKCYHITGEPGNDKYLRCNVDLGDNTNSYILSGWIKTRTTPIRKGRELRVRAYHTGETEKLESSLAFNDYSDGWRYFTLLLPAHKWKNTTISFDFYDNIGDLYIDNLQLSKNDICTKTFDADGKVTGVASTEKQTAYEYDGYGRMKKIVTPGGVTQTFTYDKSNKTTKITASVGPNSYMTYDEYGNETSLSAHKAVTNDENGNPIKQLELYTQNTYSSNGNYLKSSKDTNESVTTYDYQENRGLLWAEMGPTYNVVDLEAMSQGFWGQVKSWSSNNFGGQKGIRFDYDYDGLERIKEVKCGLVGGESRTVSYTYDDEDGKGSGFGDLVSIKHNGFMYSYEYDNFGNVLATKINNESLSTNEYNNFNGSLKKTTYADGTSKSVDYDAYGNIIGEVTKLKGQKEDEKGTTTDSYVYYNDGNLAVHTGNTVITDNDGNTVENVRLKTEYDYSENGKVSRSTVTGKISGVDQYSRLQYTYNTQGKVQELAYEVAEGNDKKVRTYKYKSAEDGLSEKDTLPDGSTKEYKYDSLRRSTNVIYTPKANAVDGKKLYTSVGYASGMSSSKNLIGTQNSISNYVNKIGSSAKKTENTYEYGYDARGNICTIDEFNTVPGKKVHAVNKDDNERIYQYDAFGEVKRAREAYSDGTKKEYIYTYDQGGNIDEEVILQKKGKQTTKLTRKYEYDRDSDSNWRDKLVAYDDGTGKKTIDYDACGNPTEYLGKTMNWNAVNNSLALVKDGGKVYTYSYLSDGQRLLKNVDGKITIYIYNAGMLLAEDNPDYRINYYYDASGVATEIGYIKKDGEKYAKEEYFFFTRNGQGDIVGIYRSSDSKRMGTYEYDLWGNPVTIQATADDSLGITEKNPLRYRGYYYDRETKFYYLNARYYDPKIHRFISPEPNAKVGRFDKNTGLNAYNLFAYCGNDPINLCDQTGEFAITATTMIIVGVCAATGMAIGGIIGDSVATNKGYKGWDKICTVLTYMSVGGLIGGVLGLAAPYLASLLGTGLELAAAGICSLFSCGNPPPETSNKLALGINEYLPDFANKFGASTWNNFPDPNNWKDGVLEAIYNVNTRIYVNLTGLDDVMTEITRVVTNNPLQKNTGWEIYQIYQNPAMWDRVRWFKDGIEVINPFLH